MSHSLLEGQSSRDPGDIQIQPNHRTVMNMMHCIVIMINGYLGVGLAKTGRNMRTGILYCTLCNIFSALFGYYSSWMMLVVMARYKTLSFEETWIAVFNKNTLFIPFMGMFVPAVGFISFYFLSIRDVMKFILMNNIYNCPFYVYDLYLIVLVLIIVIYPYFYFSTSIGFLKISSYFGLIMTVLILIHHIYFDITNAQKYGFDPRHEISLFFNFNHPYFTCFTEHITTYIGYLFLPTVLYNLVDFTYNRGKKLLKISFLIIFCIIEIFEIFEYFTVFNDRIEDLLFFSLPPENFMVVFGCIAFFFKITVSIPPLINPARITTCSLVVDSVHPPIPLWSSMGLIVTFLAMAIATITDVYFQILCAVETFFMTMMQFTFPAVLFIKEMKFKKHSWVHWFGIVFFILLGTGFGVGNLILVITQVS